jgi:WD40 repeat protein
LILNFSDNHIITLGHILETPIEISAIEFHPENTNVLTGGCLNGQVIVWDLSSTDHRIANNNKKGDSGGGDDEDFGGGAAGGEDNEKT